MKKITKTVEQDFYVTDDGKMTFQSEEQYLRYEQDREDYRVIESLHSMKLKVPVLTEEGMLEDKWYLVRNEKERESIFRRWCSVFQYRHVNGKSSSKITDINIGDWVCRSRAWDDRERDYEGVYTLSYLIKEFRLFSGSVEKITVDGKY